MRQIVLLSALLLSCGGDVMSARITLRCAGLYTNPNDVGEVPEGAFAQADNVVVSRDGICELRRGLPTLAGAAAVRKLIPYQGHLMGIGQSQDIVYPDASSTAQSNAYLSKPIGSADNRWAEQNGRLYATSDIGLQRFEGVPTRGYGASVAGAPRALDVQLTVMGSGTMLAPGYTVGYRVVWGFLAANGDLMLGPPSGLTLVTNTGGSAANVSISTTVPSLGVYAAGETVIYQIYRTYSSPTSPPTNEPCLVYQGAYVGPVTTVSFTDNVPDAMLGAALYTNTSQGGTNAANYPPPYALDVASFRNSLFLANVTELPRLTLNLAAVGAGGIQVGDTITVTATNGSNSTAITITGAATENITANQFAVVTSGTWQSNVAATTDSIIRAINNATWKSGIISAPAKGYAYLLSGPTDPAGIIGIEPINQVFDIAFSCSRTGAFIQGTSVSKTWASQARPNRIYFSAAGQPDAFPLLNYFDIGSASQPILRVVPLRDSLVVLKSDGIWRITGDGPFNFRVDPLDVTVNLLAAETAVALENTVIALTQQGIVRISDTGVTVVSRPVEDQILPLLGPAMLATTSSVGFGIAYESGRKYLLGLPSAAGQSQATQLFVYDLFTDTWTRWPITATHGVVNPADDRLYFCDGSTLRQERKSFDATDYADSSYSLSVVASSGTSLTVANAASVMVGDRVVQGTLAPGAGAIVTWVAGNVLTLDRALSWSNGTATGYTAIRATVKWMPQTPRESGPGALAHFREADFLFRSVYLARASATFATEFDPGGDTETLSTPVGLTDPPVGPATLRVLVPRNEQRASRLSVAFSMAQAMCPMQLQGLQVVYEAGRERTRR